MALRKNMFCHGMADMKKNQFITQIIDDYERGSIKPFFDLSEYESDKEISRFFKYLVLGYIKKELVNDPRWAICIDFGKKGFTMSSKNCASHLFSEGVFYRDLYQNYSSPAEVYEVVQAIVDNLEVRLQSILSISEINALVNQHNRKDPPDSKAFGEAIALLSQLEADGELIIEGDEPLACVKELMEVNSTGFDRIATVICKWNRNIQFRVGVSACGNTLLRRLKPHKGCFVAQ